MKLSLLVPLLLIALNVSAQNNFKGKWYRYIDDSDDILVPMEINDKTTLFDVVENQLSLECRNEFAKDTLALYVISSDQGRGFAGPKYYPPKPGSMFAKCFIRSNQLHIIYTQKMFKNNIKNLELSTVLYRH